MSPSISLRNYWISRYEDKFNERYNKSNLIIELCMFKRLLKNFDYYLILEAIDQFFFNIKNKKELASIKLFASNKYFNRNFENLIKSKEIIKYKRLILWYSEENQKKIRSLLQRYNNYLYAISLSDEDINEKYKIIEELKMIPTENNI